MEFDLTHEIVDQIIFAMEDQKEEFLVDKKSGEVVPATGSAGADPGDRFVGVPEWEPVDGFQLMERFLTTLRNPILRERLREALSSGRGVFRNFKDALRGNAGMERRWYLFKERQMRRVVYEWYNEMRELNGLEKLPFDVAEAVEDSEELLLSEFSVGAGQPEYEAAMRDLDRSCFQEVFAELPADTVQRLYDDRCRKYPDLFEPDSVLLMAEDCAGTLAGMVWAVQRRGRFEVVETWKIIQLAVASVYRGLGLSGVLLRELMRRLYERGAARVTVDLVVGALGLSEFFEHQGFSPVSQLMGIDLAGWAES